MTKLETRALRFAPSTIPRAKRIAKALSDDQGPATVSMSGVVRHALNRGLDEMERELRLPPFNEKEDECT